MRIMKNKSGYTIVELLISLGIFTVIIGSLMTILILTPFFLQEL